MCFEKRRALWISSVFVFVPSHVCCGRRSGAGVTALLLEVPLGLVWFSHGVLSLHHPQCPLVPVMAEHHPSILISHSSVRKEGRGWKGSPSLGHCPGLCTALPSDPTSQHLVQGAWEVKSEWPLTHLGVEDSLMTRTVVLTVCPQPAALLSQSGRCLAEMHV